MKQLYRILNIVLWCFTGAFIGSTIYRYYDYNTHPDLYAIQSAPWYLSIQIQGIFTIIIVVIILIIMWFLKKKIN